ncbi:NADH-quinone oxidoreductase subunit N [Ignavibacteria bacterium]
MLQDFLNSAPIPLLSALATLVMLLDAMKRDGARIVFGFSVFSLTAAMAAAIYTMFLPDKTTAFNNMITCGGYGAYFDIVFCLGGVLTLLAARPFLLASNTEHGEFYSLILFSICGMFLIAHSNNLLTLFIGIEVMSVSFYILSGYLRTSRFSIEASLKYFLLGAFITGFLVYGMALIYGSAGALGYNEIYQAVQGETGARFPMILLLGVGLLIIGLSFKSAIFPFHQWAPDVYQGAPTIVTAFMSTAGKAAAFSAFIPILAVLTPESSLPVAAKIGMLLAVLSAATMLVGNISAVVQKNIKRMLAYSSVAHAGYMMMGLAAGSVRGASGIVFYVTAYMFMQIGAFILISALERGSEERYQNLEDYAGLAKKHPVMAALMSVFMLSLTGIPPFAGFFGKYYLFTAAIESGYTWLTIIAVISSVISVYFYIGLIVAMYFRESDVQEQDSRPGLAGISLVISAAGVIILGVIPQFIDKIAKSLF